MAGIETYSISEYFLLGGKEDKSLTAPNSIFRNLILYAN